MSPHSVRVTPYVADKKEEIFLLSDHIVTIDGDGLRVEKIVDGGKKLLILRLSSSEVFDIDYLY